MITTSRPLPSTANLGTWNKVLLIRHSPMRVVCGLHMHKALYDLSHTAGDSKGFTDTYLEAIKLQQQAQRSISQDSNEIFEQLLPYEVYMRIFGYLSAPDLCKIMTVCKVRSTMMSRIVFSGSEFRLLLPLSLSYTHTHTHTLILSRPGMT